MKKLVASILIILSVGIVFAQDKGVIKQEQYIQKEIGEKAFEELVESLISEIFSNYCYVSYSVVAPYKNEVGESYTSWATMVGITYYRDGTIVYRFYRNDTCEHLAVSNDMRIRNNGIEGIMIRYSDYALNRDGLTRLKNIIRSEQAKAVAAVYRKIENDSGGVMFYVSQNLALK